MHEVARSQYDVAQREAWAPRVPDPATWLPILLTYDTVVAVDEADEPVAWISMTETGYIDMLFCAPEAVGCGLAGRLYDTVEQIAKQRGLTAMSAHASLLAQPFLAKRGWRVEKHERHVKNGVEVPRAAMSKPLARRSTIVA